MPKIVKVTKEQFDTLKTNGSITVDGTTITYSSGDLYMVNDTSTCTWTDGTSSGPYATITSSTGNTISIPSIPAAGDGKSGIVTTGAQSFSGTKTFKSSPIIQGSGIKIQGTSQGSQAFLGSFPVASQAFNFLGTTACTIASALSTTSSNFLRINTGTSNDVLIQWGRAFDYEGKMSVWYTNNVNHRLITLSQSFSDTNYIVIPVTKILGIGNNSIEYESADNINSRVSDYMDGGLSCSAIIKSEAQFYLYAANQGDASRYVHFAVDYVAIGRKAVGA